MVVSVFLSFVPFQILECTERYVETYLYERKELSLKNGSAAGFDHIRADNAVVLSDTYTDSCILIWHVINANTLAQHVRFEELPSGFDSGSRRVVVFFYNRAALMETAV